MCGSHLLSWYLKLPLRCLRKQRFSELNVTFSVAHSIYHKQYLQFFFFTLILCFSKISFACLIGKLVGMETCTYEWFCENDYRIYGRAGPARIKDESFHLRIFLPAAAGWQGPPCVVNYILVSMDASTIPVFMTIMSNIVAGFLSITVLNIVTLIRSVNPTRRNKVASLMGIVIYCCWNLLVWLFGKNSKCFPNIVFFNGIHTCLHVALSIAVNLIIIIIIFKRESTTECIVTFHRHDIQNLKGKSNHLLIIIRKLLIQVSFVHLLHL